MERRRALLSAANQSSSSGDEDSALAKYCTIEALEDNLVVGFYPINLMEIYYSVDGTTWSRMAPDDNDLDLMVAPAINKGERIYLKGSYDADLTSNYIGYFNINNKFNLLGNCLSLIFNDGADFRESLMGYKYVFYGLFWAQSVVEVSDDFLPSMTLEEHCYDSMFDECVYLTKPPKLPALMMESYCYYSMFNYCTNLTNAPELPATILADSCYENMFSETNIITAPQLPATKLKPSCYRYMFAGCNNLINAPELPATTLEPYCYASMFFMCDSLVNAPKLPATSLAQYCYNNMFEYCSQLKYIKADCLDIGSAYSYSWLTDVSSSGIFVKNPDATWTDTGDYAVPNRWRIVTEGPDPENLIVFKVGTNYYMAEKNTTWQNYSSGILDLLNVGDMGGYVFSSKGYLVNSSGQKVALSDTIQDGAIYTWNLNA